ncbi:MAG: S41 family peptidase [Candidatus Eisenbacteria bacterium]|uniref:S41 family peptidase n=1 Tax=Eiseniibacteriota bacterium TaxID=2212470 RepID=A0A538TNR5_UNCEI|nr:MAG: S41 family peptidase [Candidatus Eisenbacteria bacterium]
MASFRRNSLGPLAVAMGLSLLLGFGMARGLFATDDLRSQLDLFSQVLYLVQNNYVEPPDNPKLVKGAIDGMLRTLDPHSVFLQPQRARRMDEEFHGEYSGIGIQFDIQDGAIRVISPLEGTPSYRLGIRAGDRIVEIDGQPVSKTITNDDVFRLLRGPSGTVVAVTIEREGEAAPLHFSIERAKIPIESVPYAFMIRPGVGYVRVIRFSQTTGEELEKALTSLRQQGMKSLLLDLRANSGGLLSQAVDVLDQLVPSSRKVVYTRGRISSANADYYSSDRPKQLQGPLVVLIDHGSASASEIVAGAVQDLDRGLVAGTNSFGKGLVQNQFNLSDGSKLLLTIAKYYTPSGRLIQRDYSKANDASEYTLDAWKEDAPTDSELAARPKFKTGVGRTVYGGGGILPDQVIPDPQPLTRVEVDMIQKRVFFEWATSHLAQMKGQHWTAQSFDKDFKLSDQDWAHLRKIMDARKVAVDSVWESDRPFMLRQIRSELASATVGSLPRYRILVEDDSQLSAALELFPRASKLLTAVGPEDGAAPADRRKTHETATTPKNNR